MNTKRTSRLGKSEITGLSTGHSSVGPQVIHLLVCMLKALSEISGRAAVC